MHRRTVPIVFAFNDAYKVTACACISSLLATQSESTFYKIYVIYSDQHLSEGVRRKLTRYLEKEYDYFSLQWISLNSEIFESAPTRNWLSIESYYRLLIPDLIPQHDKIIWADSDFIFRRDIGELFKIELGDADVAASKDIINKPEHCTVHAYFPEVTRDYIYTTCLMVINAQKWREDNLVTRCLDNIDKYRDRLRLPDLDIVNLTARKIIPLPCEAALLLGFLKDPNYYKQPGVPFSKNELDEALKSLYIIHYAGVGDTKPWKSPNPHAPRFKDWMCYAKKGPFGKRYGWKRRLKKKLKKLGFLST